MVSLRRAPSLHRLRDSWFITTMVSSDFPKHDARGYLLLTSLALLLPPLRGSPIVFTTDEAVASLSNMKAKSLLKERRSVTLSSFMEMVVWQVAQPVKGSLHGFKYSLAYVVDEVCVLRYDNEAGKGDHKHLDKNEVPYEFTTATQLVNDFLLDIELWRQENEHGHD